MILGTAESRGDKINRNPLNNSIRSVVPGPIGDGADDDDKISPGRVGPTRGHSFDSIILRGGAAHSPRSSEIRSNCYICEMLYGAMRSDEVKRDNPINAGERSLRRHPHRGTSTTSSNPQFTIDVNGVYLAHP